MSVAFVASACPRSCPVPRVYCACRACRVCRIRRVRHTCCTPPRLSRLPRLPCPWHSPRPPYLPHAAVSACRPACHVCRACRVRGIRRVRHTCRMPLYPHAAPPGTSAAPAVSARLLHPLPLRMPCPSRPPHVAASACRRICCIRRVPMPPCPQRAGEPRPGRPCAPGNERGAPRKGTLLFVRSGGTFARRPFRSVISR